MVDFAALAKRNKRREQFFGLDFEAQSVLDISDVGATQYAAHPSTDILCLAFKDEAYAGDADIWFPELQDNGEAIQRIDDAVRSEEWTFVAHNAQFDRTLWAWMHAQGKFPVPPPPMAHWICTAQRASVNGLPRGLDECCAALDMPGKDKEGRTALLKWCKPQGRGAAKALVRRPDIPATERLKIWGYARQDVDRMFAIKQRTKPVSEAQQLYFELDYAINCRGFAVDRAKVDKIIQRLNEAQAELIDRAIAATGEFINLNSTDQIHAYCRAQGVDLAKCDAHHIRQALKRDDLPPDVRDLLTLRQLAALKASSKFAAFRQRGMVEGDYLIVRDWAVVDGASTGRHSARGFQAQNLKREICTEEEVEALLNDDVETIRLLYDEPLKLAGMAVRPMITARSANHVLLIGDFSRIELCTLFWFAKELKALGELRDGTDLYKRLASVIYREIETKISKEQRQLGKTGVLGNGYGLGAAGFQTQLTEKYGIEIDFETAERAVYGYRDMFPGVPKFWSKVGDALFKAVSQKGVPFALGPLKFVADDDQLVIVLPDGSKLRYQKPYIDGRDVMYWGEDSKTHQWCPQKLWGGAATGHIVQATANRLQRLAAFALTKAGFGIVLHAHDEIVCEASETLLEEFERIMSFEDPRSLRPDWAKGMFIKVDAVATKTYRKG